MSYKQSVLNYADDQGNLDEDVVIQLLDEHDTTIENFIADGYPEQYTFHAETLLDWMGYW